MVKKGKKHITNEIENVSGVIKINKNLNQQIKASNIFNKYSTNSLDKLFSFAKNLNISDEILLGFIKVGNIKEISYSQLLKQMDNYVNIVLKRGYPFKFIEVSS
ncbi:hypothetical protein [Tenacibaculum maritimum]|uniref:hypothetical protein n=1 Tax=Tenacibaculum maritimum TaxID=107401 RepID=UPI0013300C48|nr:hypothetical protein [Tenacibaculum maritimum]